MIKLTSFGLPPIGKGTSVAIPGSATSAQTQKTVDLTQVAGAYILGLAAADIAKLSPEQIAMMSATAFGKLGADQMAALTKAQLAERAVADGVRAMRQQQFPKIAANHMKYLTTAQLGAANSAWWFSRIPQASRDRLSKTQIQAVSPSVMGPNVGKLSVQQLDWLSAKQFAAVKGAYAIAKILEKKPSMVSRVTPSQIAAIKNGWWLGRFPKQSLQAMSQAQISAVPANIYSHIKAKLTATQQAWRP